MTSENKFTAMKKINSFNLFTREVWTDNLDEEVAIIRELVRSFLYIAMDTEFPGVVRSQNLNL